MSNIKVSLIANIGSPSLLTEYGEYINAADESARTNLQQKLEKSLGKQIFGAKKVVGDARFEQDWYIDDKKAAQEIVNNLGMFQIDNDGVLRIEAKLQRKGEDSGTLTGIGGSVLFQSKGVRTESLDFSILREIKRRTKSTDRLRSREQGVAFESIILESIKAKETAAAKFNYLAAIAPKTIHAPAYQKSKNLTIFSKTAGSLQAYNIFFPRSKFKTPIFGVSVSDRTIKYELQTSFEKQIVSRLKTLVPKDINKQNEKEQLELQKSLVSNLRVAGKKKTSIIYGRGKQRTEDKIDIIYYTTNSMPMSKGIIRGGKKLKVADEGPSLIDISVAVRNRTRLRMRRGDREPYPPKIFERSGDFRSSIEAVANLQSNMIEYFYTPYYDRLERYGYEINDLVEGSIRAIAQSKFNRRFNLTRRFT